MPYVAQTNKSQPGHFGGQLLIRARRLLHNWSFLYHPECIPNIKASPFQLIPRQSLRQFSKVHLPFRAILIHVKTCIMSKQIKSMEKQGSSCTTACIPYTGYVNQETFQQEAITQRWSNCKHTSHSQFSSAGMIGAKCLANTNIAPMTLQFTYHITVRQQ